MKKTLKQQLLERDAVLAQMREALECAESYRKAVVQVTAQNMPTHFTDEAHACLVKSLDKALSTDAGKQFLERLRKAEAEILAIQQEEVRRIRHLNRLGTWAQQDPTGPIVRDQIQAWVLAELKAALGSAYEPTSWQPETAMIGDLEDRLQAVEKKLEQAVSLLRSSDEDAVSKFLETYENRSME